MIKSILWPENLIRPTKMIIINNSYNIFIPLLFHTLVSVLVVDDARFMRLLLKEILISTIPSVNVIEASNTTSAIEMYNKERPDLVTMDINLPSTDGITCMKEILKINPHAKVIMVSGIDQKQPMETAMNSGALGYVTKPFNKIKLISKVKEILDEYS